MFKRGLKNKKGFTLVELMVVVAIMAVLVAIAIPVFNSVTAKAEKGTCQANQRIIESAIAQYNLVNDTPLGDSNDGALEAALFTTTKYVQSWPTCPGEGTAYTYTASTGKVTCSHGAHN